MATQASLRCLVMTASALALMTASPAAALGGGELFGEPVLARARHVGHAGGQRMASLLQQQVQRISPSLYPESDKKFFKKDYPDDLRPESRDVFQYPHPIIQDSSEYDRDYVKDENSDSGEWKAQESYDHLRHKMAEANKAENELLKSKVEAKRAHDAAQAAEHKAFDDLKEEHVKAKEAHKKVEKAKEKAAEEADKLKEVGADTAAIEGSPVGDAVKEVDKELSDVDGCKKALEKAQAKLKELKGESSDAQAKQIKKAEDAQEQVESMADEDAALEEAEEEAKKKSKGLDDEVKKDKVEYEKAHEEWKEDAKKLKEMNEELEKAEQSLRRFRQSGVDKGGGVYRSSAARGVPAGPLFIAALSVVVTVALGA